MHSKTKSQSLTIEELALLMRDSRQALLNEYYNKKKKLNWLKNAA